MLFSIFSNNKTLLNFITDNYLLTFCSLLTLVSSLIQLIFSLVEDISYVKTEQKKRNFYANVLDLEEYSSFHELDVLVPYIDHEKKYYGKRRYSLLEEVSLVNDISSLFLRHEKNLSVKILSELDPSNPPAGQCLILLGGPAVQGFDIANCLKEGVDFCVSLYGKESDYKSDNDIKPRNSEDTREIKISYITDCNEMLSIVDSGGSMSFSANMTMSNEGIKKYSSDYACFVKLKGSDVFKSLPASKTVLLMFGHSILGTKAAALFFKDHFEDLSEMFNKYRDPEHRVFLCYPVNKDGKVSSIEPHNLTGFLKENSHPSKK